MTPDDLRLKYRSYPEVLRLITEVEAVFRELREARVKVCLMERQLADSQVREAALIEELQQYRHVEILCPSCGCDINRWSPLHDPDCPNIPY